MFDSTAVYGGRNMAAFRAPFNTTNAFPDADTIDFGDPWGTPWVPLGFTQEGMEYEVSMDYEDIEVDQALLPVLSLASGMEVMGRTTLAEYKPANILVGVGQGEVSTEAADEGTRGWNEYSLTTNIVDTYYSFGFDFKKNDDGEPIRGIIWKARPVGGVSSTFGVSDQNPAVPVEMKGFPDTSVSPGRILSIRDHIAALPVTP